MKRTIEKITSKAYDRFSLSAEFIKEYKLKEVAELGVYRGEFAEKILQSCDQITKYILIDPWRNLDDWNKPANKSNEIFDLFYKEAMFRTNFAAKKRIVLRGKTTEIINQIENESLDLVYIDGDHTLKGISIDLINLWPKIKKNGFILGDDFVPSIWQHGLSFEPTMIFPFAIYFAEAVNTRIYGLPYGQFLITKEMSGYEFIDLTNGLYKNTNLKHQFVNNSKSIFR